MTGPGIVRTGGNSSQTVSVDGTFSVPTIEAIGGVRLDINSDASVDTLRLGHPTIASSSRRIGGSGTLTITKELTWINGYMSGNGTTVVKQGATFELDVRSAYTGLTGSRTFINESTGTWTGSHQFGNSSSESTFINRGTLELSNEWTGTYGTVFFGGTFTNEGTFIAASDTTARFASGFNNHGLVDVRSGTLELSGFNATGGTDSGAYVLADGARLGFTGGVRTLTETASIAGTGTVVIRDGGDWHEVVNGATWRPGASPGALTIASDYPAHEGVIEIELGGYAAGLENDLLIVEGRARLGGTLRLALLNDFKPEIGDRFVVLRAAEVTGNFEAVEAPDGIDLYVETTDSSAVVVIGQPVSSEKPGEALLPAAFALHLPYPNPFIEQTTLGLGLPESTPVRIEVFDMLDRRITVLVNDALSAGRHRVQFDGSDLPAGIYFARVTATNVFVATRRMVRVR